MTKKRELELKVEHLNMQADQLNAQIKSLNEQLSVYRSQEQAIVQALTQAQASAARHVEEARADAARIVSQAQEQADVTLREAGEHKASALREAEETAQQSSARAAATVEAAQAEASRRLAQAEASVQDFEARLNALNDLLRDTAAQARDSAQAFAASLETLHQDAPELLEESKGLSALIRQNAGNLPEAYNTPQELMHSIYQLQGRELPQDSADEQPDADSCANEGAPAEETPKAETPEAKVPAAEASSQEDAPEEHLWTVDEVIKHTAHAASSGEPDVDLDSLLDEIIKE